MKILFRVLGLILFTVLVMPMPLSAQDASDHSSTLPDGLFKPEFIVEHQQEIQLTEEQRQSIMKEVMNLQAKMPGLQDGPEKMQLMLGTVSRINNVLTDDQKQKLTQLQEKYRIDTAQQLFTNPQRVIIEGYTENVAKEPFISRDGQYLFFNNAVDKPGEDCHVFYASRINDTAFKFIGPVKGMDGPLKVPEGINSQVPSMDRDGNIYFTTNRSYKSDFKTIYHGHFNKNTVTGVGPVEGISDENPDWYEMDCEISADGRTLYYNDNTGQGPFPSVSITKVASKNVDGTFTPLANSDDLLKNVNNSGFNYAPSSTPDGLELFFTHGMGEGIYVAKRSSTSEPFDTPQVAVSGADGLVEAPSISSDGKHLYYAKKSGDDPYAFDIYVSTRKSY